MGLQLFYVARVLHYDKWTVKLIEVAECYFLRTVSGCMNVT